MSTKNYTSFLCRIAVGFAAAFFLSCNVIQMATGEKTRIGNFNGGGPGPYYVFFEDSGLFPMVLNTEHGRIVTVNGSATSALDFTYYGGYAFYSAVDTNRGIYRYDFYSESGELALNVNPVVMESYGERLFYVKSSDGNLCYLSGPLGAETCHTSQTFPNAYFLKNDTRTMKLFMCDIGSLYQIDPSTGQSSAIDPEGSETSVACGSLYDGLNYINGFFIHYDTSSGYSVNVYDTAANTLASHSVGSYFEPVGISRSGNIYIEHDGSLKRLSIEDGSITTLVSGAGTVSPPVLETPNEILFISDMGTSTPQIYRLPHGSTDNPEQASNFTNAPTAPYYLAVGPGAFYFLHYNGVEKVYFEEGSENIYNSNVSGVLGVMRPN